MRAVVLFATTLALVAGGAAPAPAAERPAAGAVDHRVIVLDFAPDRVVALATVLRTATQIRLAPGERVLHAALGDARGWEIAAEGSLVFIKPLTLRPPTNMIVSTRAASGALRHYVFELRVRATTSRGGAAPYVVAFRYPEEQAAGLAEALEARASALRRRLLQLRLARAALTGPRNLAYELQGSEAIAPSEVSDDGRFTVLRFPGAAAMPAVYVVAADGTEAVVPFDVRGERLVVHQTARLLRLRRGREVLCIFNHGYDPGEAPAATGTSAPDVIRVTSGSDRP